jgi:SAM-dependent methyltransferase
MFAPRQKEEQGKSMKSVLSQAQIKKQMEEHTDGALRAMRPVPMETDWYHDYFRRIPFQALRELLTEARVDLSGKSVHLAGCGNGIDLFYLKQFCKSSFHVSDISANAVGTVIATDLEVTDSKEDMECLSFEDGAFDWSFTATSLHHLPRPALGVYELLRTSREGVIFIEPQDTWLTRLFVRLGLAQEYEVFGNYVYRWAEHDVEKLCKSLYYKWHVKQVFALHGRARNPVEFFLLKTITEICNFAVPSLGNYFICMIRKPKDL